jgi:hypothetical protein
MALQTKEAVGAIDEIYEKCESDKKYTCDAGKTTVILAVMATKRNLFASSRKGAMRVGA